MIGDVRYVGRNAYLEVNDRGTLEKLPSIKWYKQLWLFWLNRTGHLHLEDVRNAWRKS
jgi:hypothetical protein